MSKSVHDAGWFMAKTFFGYKATKLGKDFEERHEAWSSCTCSSCLEVTGPRGLKQLGVREWVCSNCGTLHDRDTNAALNILNLPLGHQRPNGNPRNKFLGGCQRFRWFNKEEKAEKEGKIGTLERIKHLPFNDHLWKEEYKVEIIPI